MKSFSLFGSCPLFSKCLAASLIPNPAKTCGRSAIVAPKTLYCFLTGRLTTHPTCGYIDVATDG